MVTRRWTWIRRSINPIVIDFGHHTVRMLQMSNDGRKVQVIARAYRRMPWNPAEREDLHRLRAEAVRDMLKHEGFQGRKVISVLPWELNAIRNLRVPCMPEKDLHDVIHYEACERFGYEPGQAEIRYLSAGEVRQGTEMRHEVIAFGATVRELDDHLEMIERLGLMSVGLDPGPCALFRSFERFLKREEDRQKVCAIVDLGHSATRVLVSRGDQPILFKAISMGGATLDEAVGQLLEVSPAEANSLRHGPRDDGSNGDSRDAAAIGDSAHPRISGDRLRECMAPAASQLAKEIGLCLRYCSVTFRGMQTPTVYLVGGGARDDVLRDLLEKHLVPPVEVGRCLRDIEIDLANEAGRDRRSGEPEWTTAVGAGLKSMTGQEVLVS